jgi:hypothetical protein
MSRVVGMGPACALLFVLLVNIVVLAQDKPLAEVTGSYQFNYLRLSADSESGSTNIPLGWDGSVNVPITRSLGAVGDVGHLWKTESSLIGTIPVSASASIGQPVIKCASVT